MKPPLVVHSSEVLTSFSAHCIAERSFSDIDNQGSAQQELYFYMNSNHEQTEAYRTGFFGP
jgi:hypothetical protein